MRQRRFVQMRVMFCGLLLAAAGCTCESGTIAPTPPTLEVDPEVLDLGEIPLGALARGVISLRNRGTSSLTLTELVMDKGEFRIVSRPDSDRIAANGSEAVVVETRPEVLGPLQDTLFVRSDDPKRPEVSVIIRLVAVEPPPCDDRNDCTDDVFNPDTEQCEHSFADGRACSPADRCLIDAVCSQGVCLGQRKTCTDDNACTRDLCRQIDGECVFLEEEDICDDDNPCTADYCDAEGCQHEPVLNGTPCDDGDGCTLGDACLAGECVGEGEGDGTECDDGNSCTINDLCVSGVCEGTSILGGIAEGEKVFEFPLTAWQDRAFLHRREVSLDDQGVFYGLDHLRLSNDLDITTGLTHVIFTVSQCGDSTYEFAYRPPDALVSVWRVRREMQLQPDGTLRIVVGVRQLPDNGFAPQSTSYILDPKGNVLQSNIRASGGETGRSLLPDGSHVFGVVQAISTGPVPLQGDPNYLTNLSVVRETVTGQVLWRHDRTFGLDAISLGWAEYLGVAGPRVLFWADGRFGALDFNTGSQVWARETRFVASEMALSTGLNLGVTRVGTLIADAIRGVGRVLGVEIIEGREVFLFPEVEDPAYTVRTDPVISPDGRIYVMMQRSIEAGPQNWMPSSLEWVELTSAGEVKMVTPLSDYIFPLDPWSTRHEDFGDDPYPTIADDGVAYVGFGDHFWAIDPDGQIRWTLTSTIPNAFTGTVPLLRDDGVMLISEGSRKILGIRTNGGRMMDAGWSSFRHDNRRTNFTP